VRTQSLSCGEARRRAPRCPLEITEQAGPNGPESHTVDSPRGDLGIHTSRPPYGNVRGQHSRGFQALQRTLALFRCPNCRKIGTHRQELLETLGHSDMAGRRRNDANGNPVDARQHVRSQETLRDRSSVSIADRDTPGSTRKPELVPAPEGEPC